MSAAWDPDPWRDVFSRLELGSGPVAVRYSAEPPDGLDRLDEQVALCEMLKFAREGRSFYADVENHACPAGRWVVHGEDTPPPFKSGELGAGLKIFKDPEAAAKVYDHVPTIDPETARYIAFAPLSEVAFEPDLLVVLAELRQAEILLRAMSYTSGRMWTSSYTNVIGCSWLLAQPHVTGELNYVPTGFSYGMRVRNVFDEGFQVVSIPRSQFSELLSNLLEMPWVLPTFQPGGEEFVGELKGKLGIEPAR